MRTCRAKRGFGFVCRSCCRKMPHDDAEGKRHVCCIGAALPCCPNAFQQQGICADTDDGAMDPYGFGCADYTRNPRWCSGYDDADFISSEMCCACGGGQHQALTTSALLQRPYSTHYEALFCIALKQKGNAELTMAQSMSVATGHG